MDIRELKEIVDQEVQNLKDYQKVTVLIAIKGGSPGGTSCEPIISAECGFDWDSGKFILRTQRLLSNKPPTKQQKRIAELEEALKMFVHRVETGEVRSKKTYLQFKQLLSDEDNGQ